MRCRYALHTACALKTVVLILMLLEATACASQVFAQTDPLHGIYRDDQLLLELNPPALTGESASYTGVIQLGEQRFPFSAQALGGLLQGAFESQGARFEFTASVAGQVMVFTTEGTTYRLRKAMNPLAKPAQPNPLAQSPPSSTLAESLPRTNAPAALSDSKARSVLFKRYSIVDDPSMISGEAFSLLIPADWQVEGGLRWRMHAAVPANVSLRVSSPDRAQVLEAFPAIPFIWREGGIPLFPAGANYQGNEVAEPIQDAATYIRQVTLRRFRQELIGAAAIVSVEELPKIAEAVLAETAQEPGLERKFHAARVRLEYVEKGRTMQEDIYCVLGSAYAPAIRTTFWGADRNFSFRAEKGTLETRGRFFQTMVSSFRPNLYWFNRYVQLVQFLGQNQFDPTRPASELSRVIAQTHGEVSDGARQLFERQRLAQERLNATFSQLFRGTAEYRSPVENRAVELPSGYEAVWVNARGDYFLSQLPGAMPGAGSPGDWKRVELVR